jgi:general secretion pathway protein D
MNGLRTGMMRRMALGVASLLALAAARAQEPAAAPAAAPAVPVQVRIEARVLEWQVTDGMDFSFAVQYAGAGGGGILQAADLTLPSDPSLDSAARIFFDGLSAGDAGSFDAVIETLQTAGEVKILSQPSIVVTAGVEPMTAINTPNPMPGEKAKLSNAMRIPYESTRAIGYQLASITEYMNSGVTMEVSVPRVEGPMVVLDLTTEVTELTGFINIGLNTLNQPVRVPTLDSRKIVNRLVAADGSVFIAGLMKTTRQYERTRGVPWLSELPVVKYFFSNRHQESSDSELVFLVKPEIMTPWEAQGEAAAAPAAIAPAPAVPAGGA